MISRHMMKNLHKKQNEYPLILFNLEITQLNLIFLFFRVIFMINWRVRSYEANFLVSSDDIAEERIEDKEATITARNRASDSRTNCQMPSIRKDTRRLPHKLPAGSSGLMKYHSEALVLDLGPLSFEGINFVTLGSKSSPWPRTATAVIGSSVRS